MSVSISKVIEKAQDIVHDPQIGFAAEISYLVQEVEIDGKTYELRITLKEKDDIEQE